MTMVFNIVGLLGRLPLFDRPRAHRSRAVHRAVHATGRTRRTTSRARSRRPSSASPCRWRPATRASTCAAAPRRSGSPRRGPWSPARSLFWCTDYFLIRHALHILWPYKLVNETRAPAPSPAATPGAPGSVRAGRRAVADPGARPAQDLRAPARPARRRSRHRAGQHQHHHRRLRPGEVGADEAPHGPAQARRGTDLGRRRGRGAARRAGHGTPAPQVRHGVPVCGPVRFA